MESLPKKIGPYNVINELGEGNYGKIYLVESHFEESYAAKVIPLKKISIEKAVEEAKIYMSIKHPNVMRIREEFKIDQDKYFVMIMELCDGGDLSNIIGKEKDEQCIINLMVEMVEGVQAIHQQTIIHRDIKPENIFIKNGHVKIGDLGVSKMGKTQAQTQVGTLTYIAPEFGTGKYDNKVDIWALALVFMELVVGQRLDSLADGGIPGFMPDFPAVETQSKIKNKILLDLILRMLAREPKNRIALDQILLILKCKQLQNVKNIPAMTRTKQYENGVYTGEMIGDSREGKGTMELKNGDKYEGMFKNDQFNGKGKYFFSDGTRKGDEFQGEYLNGKRHGKGVYIYVDNSKFEGEYKDDKANGYGVMISADGEKYDGEWKEDKRDGKGVCIYADGEKYDGEYKEDKQNGKGLFIFKDGRVYTGDLKNSKRHGKGIIKSSNGDYYDGEWNEDKRHGQGIVLEKGIKYKTVSEKGKEVKRQKI